MPNFPQGRIQPLYKSPTINPVPTVNAMASATGVIGGVLFTVGLYAAD